MAKTPLNRDSIRKRIQDETRGITPGATQAPINFGELVKEKEKEPVPDARDIGLTLPVQKQLADLTAHHLELTAVLKQAERDRNDITARIKELLAEHVAEDIHAFSIGNQRIARFSQNRTKFDQDRLKVELANSGVRGDIIRKAMEAATSPYLVTMLKVTPLSGAEEE